MSAALSRGAIQALYNNNVDDQYVLQVIEVKKLVATAATPGTTPTSDRYRLVLSDGEYYQQSMLATQLNDLVTSGQLQNMCVVKVTECICNVVQNRRIIIVLSLSVISPPVNKIGSPLNIDTARQTAPTSMPMNAPAANPSFPQHQQVMAPPQYAVGSGYNQSDPPLNAGSNYAQNYGGHSAISRVGPSAPIPLSALHPYQKKWTVKARVTQKCEVRRWHNAKGEGKLFSFDIVDEEGSEMRCTSFNEVVDKFAAIIDSGKVYLISGGQVKVANKKFITFRCEYEIALDNTSEIVLAGDMDDKKIPTAKYDFKSIASLREYPKQTFVDVIGVVTGGTDPVSITTKSGTNTRKRNITIVDKSSASIEITLWGDFADKFIDISSGDAILVAKGVSIGDYNGCSLSTMRQSNVEINPDIPAAHDLASWWSVSGNSTNITAIGVRSDGGVAAKKTLAEVAASTQHFDEKADMFANRSLIAFIRHNPESPPWYPACPTNACNKKVTDQGGGQWRCEKCNMTHSHCEYRYILSMSISDPTSQQWVTGFNDIGQSILGKSANEMAVLKERQPEVYESVFADAAFLSFNFNIRVKNEVYNGEDRIKYSVASATPTNYAVESREQIKSIFALLSVQQ